MKLRDFFTWRSGLDIAYQLRLGSGGKTFRLRKLINAIFAEMQEFEEFRKELVTKSGLTTFDQTDPVVIALNKELEDAANEEAKTKIEALIEAPDLDSAKISALEIDQLVLLGLLKDPDAKEVPPEEAKKEDEKK